MIEVEIIDPATLKPSMPRRFFGRSGKPADARIHDSPEFAGFGAEILAMVASDESAFHSLKAVPKRLCGKEMPIPFAYELEKSVVVSKEEIVRSVRSLFTMA